MDIFEKIKNAGDSLRRKVNILVRADKETGQALPVPISAEEHFIGSDGSPNTVRYTVPQVYDCRHSVERPFGGQCVGCRGQSCAECHGHCADCRQPICFECSRFWSPKSQSPVRRCVRCDGDARRTHTVKRVGWALLSPFVEPHAEKRKAS